MKDYRKAKRTVEVSVGESVRIMRELQELSQTELAKVSGTPQSTIPVIENDRIHIGVERAKVLARALKCHPAVLVFPGWDIKDVAAAYAGSRFLVIKLFGKAYAKNMEIWRSLFSAASQVAVEC